MNDITLRCLQPWPGGILGRPVVPVHQPRLSHKWESNPTVHCFYFTKSVEQRLYCVPTVERATGVLSVEMCIFWKSKHLFPASDNFFSRFLFPVLFILSMPVQSAQQTSSVWRSASFERVNICFQVFIVFLALFVSSAFHFNCLSCSIRVANWFFMYNYWPWTHLQILEKCNCEATQNEKWVCFPISGGPKPKALDRMP